MPISRPVSPSPPALFASVAVFVLGAGLAHAETADDARLRQLAGQAASYAGEVRSLLAKGADPAVPDRGGRTAVHAAARIGAIETVAALLDAGGDPNKRDEDGNTPLHLAANASQPTLVNQSIATIRVLLAEGADPCIRNARGLFPYSVAAEGGRLRQVLNRAGACEKHGAVSLDLSQRRQIQEALTSAGFDSGPADGEVRPEDPTCNTGMAAGERPRGDRRADPSSGRSNVVLGTGRASGPHGTGRRNGSFRRWATSRVRRTGCGDPERRVPMRRSCAMLGCRRR